MDEQLALCKSIAEEAHAGQVRRVTGEPYIEHCRRVAESVENIWDKCVAWLHDTLEDSDLTADDLLRRGVHPIIVSRVIMLTRSPDEPYSQYLHCLRGSESCRCIKVADLIDNVTSHPSEKARIKYRAALKYLTLNCLLDLEAIDGI